MLNPISTITVESALSPATSGPESATADLFQSLIAELLEPTQAPPQQLQEQQARQEQREQQIPLLGKGLGGWFRQPLNNNPGIELPALSAPQRNEAIFFMAQPPLLREGGEYASSQRDAAEPIIPAASDTPVEKDIQPAQTLSRAQIGLPAMEVTSIKIETEALPAPVAKATVPSESPRLERTFELVLTPIQSEPVRNELPGSPQVTPKLPTQVPTPVPDSQVIPAAVGGSPQFAQSGSKEKQDFRNESGRAPFPETVSTTLHLETPLRFQTHLLPMEAAAPVAHVVELPPQLPLPVAHRVSIDIGEKDSRVVVTLYQNRGDISVKIHAPNEVLSAELRSSVSTLVEAFHREHIPLANMDFTSGYSTTSDDGQQHGNQPRQPFQNRTRKSELAAAPTDQVEITSINLNA